MVEIFLIGVIIIFVLVYTNKIDKYQFIEDNKGFFELLKEKDYGFLLRLKYGDKVSESDIDELFTKRITSSMLVTGLCVFVFISNLTFLNIIICLLVGVLVFKMGYIKLKGYFILSFQISRLVKKITMLNIIYYFCCFLYAI